METSGRGPETTTEPGEGGAGGGAGGAAPVGSGPSTVRCAVGDVVQNTPAIRSYREVIVSWGDPGAAVDHYEIALVDLMAQMQRIESVPGDRRSHALVLTSRYPVDITSLTTISRDGERHVEPLSGCGLDLPQLTPAAINVDPPVVRAGAPVQLSAVTVSTTDDVAWRWELGDGAISTDPSPVHVYDQPGTYEVRVEVTTEPIRVLNGETVTESIEGKEYIQRSIVVG